MTTIYVVTHLEAMPQSRSRRAQ